MCMIEYGPFHHKINGDDLAKNGDSMLLQRDGTYRIRSSDMSTKDAMLMMKTLVSAGYEAEIVEIRPI